MGIDRHLLRHSLTFPSKNRLKLHNSIKVEFRENRHLDPNSEKVKIQRQVAFDGIKQLCGYDFVKSSSSNWVLTTEQTPMPKRK